MKRLKRRPAKAMLVPYGEVQCPRCRGKMMTLVMVSSLSLRCDCACGHKFAVRQIGACCA